MLQREHVRKLVGLLVRPATSVPADARSLARSDVLALADRIGVALRGRQLSREARAHLDETQATLRDALKANPGRWNLQTVVNLGSGGAVFSHPPAFVPCPAVDPGFFQKFVGFSIPEIFICIKATKGLPYDFIFFIYRLYMKYRIIIFTITLEKHCWLIKN